LLFGLAFANHKDGTGDERRKPQSDIADGNCRCIEKDVRKLLKEREKNGGLLASSGTERKLRAGSLVLAEHPDSSGADMVTQRHDRVAIRERSDNFRIGEEYLATRRCQFRCHGAYHPVNARPGFGRGEEHGFMRRAFDTSEDFVNEAGKRGRARAK